MEDQMERLINRVWDKFLDTPPERRLMIGIGGIPGSGKTTLSNSLTKALNARHATQSPSHPSPIAAFVPMDGYHLTRAQLSAMPDPKTAHARRGAEFTFDGASFHALVHRLRDSEPLPVPVPSFTLPDTASALLKPEQYPPGTVFAPSFDHAIKDPKENDIPILPSHRIVVFEGNYVALDKEPWRDASALMDEVWFVEVAVEVARARLAKRHVLAGIVSSEEEGDRRAVENDLPNGEEIVKNRGNVDLVVVSLEDGGWA